MKKSGKALKPVKKNPKTARAVTKPKKRDSKPVKKERRLFRIGSFLTAVFLLLYIPSFIHWISGKAVQTEIIRIGMIEDSINVKACLARNEALFSAPTDGIMIAAAREGEKIAVGGRVADIMTESSLRFLDELAVINNQLIAAVSDKTAKKSLFNSDIVKIDNDIADKIDSMVGLINAGTIENTDRIKKDIDALLFKKAEIAGDFGTDDIHVTELLGRRENILIQMQEVTQSITTESAGYVSYVVDGYEGLLPADIQKLVSADIGSIFGDRFVPEGISRLDGNRKNVKAGSVCAKVITDFRGYMLFKLESDVTDYLDEDMEISSIRINDISAMVDGVVESTVMCSDGCKIVILGIHRGMEALSAYRWVNADIIKRHYEGLKVPLKSLTGLQTEAGTAYLMLVRNNKAVRKMVRVLTTTSDFAVIDRMQTNETEGVNLYDTYIIDPLNIEEGQVIENG